MPSLLAPLVGLIGQITPAISLDGAVRYIHDHERVSWRPTTVATSRSVEPVDNTDVDVLRSARHGANTADEELLDGGSDVFMLVAAMRGVSAGRSRLPAN